MEETVMTKPSESETPTAGASKFPLPFEALTKTMAELYPGKMMEQFTKMFEQYVLPGMNTGALLERNRKNVDALAAANKRILEHAETVMARQGEMLRQTMEEASAVVKARLSADTPQTLAAQEEKLLRTVLSRTLHHMCAVAEMTAQANAEAFEAINQRITENVEDIRMMLRKREQ
jgi:phasin family protein